MIASRFRPVGWVAAVAVAALGCYLVSLRVATRRGEVTAIEAQILATRGDMRQLETELGTRSRLVQLERWNSQVLALSAPRVGQYLTSPVQLASLGAMPDLASAPAGTPGDGAVLQATYRPPMTAAGRAQTAIVHAVVHAPAPAVAAKILPVGTKPDAKAARLPKAELASADDRAARAAMRTLVRFANVKPAHRARVELASASDDDAAPALLRRTGYVRIGTARPAVRQIALLDEQALGAIERAAREETGESKKRTR